MKNKKIFTAFGKKFNREQAEWLIYADIRSAICYANMTDMLEQYIYDGFTGILDWNDGEIQGYLNDLIESNVVYHGAKEDGIDIPQLAITR